MATLRQKGSPTIFLTLSAAEFNWTELLNQVMETELDREISIEELEKMNISQTEQNKIIAQNVVQTTVYFEKRLQKIISLLSNEGFGIGNSSHNWLMSSFFYRIEFQQRGAPHVHALLWLEDQYGNQAPCFWNQKQSEGSSTENEESIEERIEKANDELILCSEDVATCPIHSPEDVPVECEECESLKQYVKMYQTHNCTFTCRKKKKILTISGDEGLGKNDCPSSDLMVPVCRFRFPR